MKKQQHKIHKIETKKTIFGLRAPGICNHFPYGARDSGSLAGIKYHDFIFEVFQQCRGYVRLLIHAKTAGVIAAYNSTGIIPGQA